MSAGRYIGGQSPPFPPPPPEPNKNPIKPNEEVEAMERGLFWPTLNEALVLSRLFEVGKLTVGEVARVIGRTQPAASLLMRGLARKGMVKRVNPINTHSPYILTEKGEAVACLIRECLINLKRLRCEEVQKAK